MRRRTNVFITIVRIQNVSEMRYGNVLMQNQSRRTNLKNNKN